MTHFKTAASDEESQTDLRESEMTLLREQISELSMKQQKGQITEKEEIKSGQVDIEVFKKYMRKFGAKSAIFVLIFQVIRYGAWLGENLWLADWSDKNQKAKPSNESLDGNSTASDSGDIGLEVRLGVYSGFGIIQTVFVVFMTLQFASGGNFSVKG